MTTFAEASYQAAKRFLQTVVIVDNQAGFLPSAPIIGAGSVHNVLESDNETVIEPEDFDTTGDDKQVTVALKENLSDAPLNAAAITEAFAVQGLICSILKPTPNNPLDGAAVAASERADVLVLDWEMGDTGQLATGIAHNLLVKDDAEGGKLRLIAIYTGRSLLRDVRAAFKEHYGAFNATAKAEDRPLGPALTLSKTEITIDVGHAKIIFLSKNEPRDGDPESVLGVPEDKLPERLLEEFAKFAGGLLSNATLASIAELRRHTHRMLARFDKSLDGPILTNRALVEHKEDAEEIAAGLILAELEAQVPLSGIAHEFMGAESVRAYFAHHNANGMTSSFMKDAEGQQLAPLDVDQVCKLIEQGLSSFDEAALDAQAASIQMDPKEYRSKIESSFHKRLYGLTGNVKDGKLAHERFAVVSMMRRDISGIGTWKEDNRPIIKLGTIITNGKNYWICLTPVCDCVRLSEGKAALLFTQLHKDTSTFEFVVPKDFGGTSVAKLRTKTKEMQLVTMNFANIEKGVVKAVIKDGHAIFEAWPLNGERKNADKYQWVGELKPMQAQRLVQNFASNMARVGLDENEWHRLQTPQR